MDAACPGLHRHLQLPVHLASTKLASTLPQAMSKLARCFFVALGYSRHAYQHHAPESLSVR